MFSQFLIFYKTKLFNDKIAKLFEGKTISLQISLFSYPRKTENLNNSRGKRQGMRVRITQRWTLKIDKLDRF